MEYLLKTIVYGNEIIIEEPESASFKTNTKNLLFCSISLIAIYVTWGMLQERIMTTAYEAKTYDVVLKEYETIKKKIEDPQFIIFYSRLFAFTSSALCIIYKKWKNQSKNEYGTAPFHLYSLCAFSNVVSSWFQYEALQYISFPMQVVSKSTKLIPVMLVGFILLNNRYKLYEYITAITITIGAVIFKLKSNDSFINDSTESLSSGILLIIGYLLFDAFTSNWQQKLFVRYRVNSVDMLCAITFFALQMTGVSYLTKESVDGNISNFISNYSFLKDLLVICTCSAFGQLIILYTIKKHGAIIFTIIMIVRQIIAIFLSRLIIFCTRSMSNCHQNF
ncbi:Adenosine 3'-phospho 5'-phosphosulfate transporter 1 [Intoshia linei]|uniref:Adenosine 3'-phospho 5'-phosphosulfate transporter 1 n=1 Tax=Intoshia linei TaxID=1819745 RepID=A0A177AT89_9BILA|nr:Adenosine 3'-phospho 5'-phosphosulfate transporter 1 [Intoshia linei]